MRVSPSWLHTSQQHAQRREEDTEKGVHNSHHNQEHHQQGKDTHNTHNSHHNSHHSHSHSHTGSQKRYVPMYNFERFKKEYLHNKPLRWPVGDEMQIAPFRRPDPDQTDEEIFAEQAAQKKVKLAEERWRDESAGAILHTEFVKLHSSSLERSSCLFLLFLSLLPLTPLRLLIG